MQPLIDKFRAEKVWKNKCLLLELIHLLMLHENNKWTVKKTAKMMKLSVGATSENLQLAKAISEFPSVSNSKSRNSALKVMKGLK